MVAIGHLRESRSPRSAALTASLVAARRLGFVIKICIVVPFSWSYWGGVVEHAQHQAEALAALGHEVRVITGNDPPGRLTKLLHGREGRGGVLPDYVVPVGRTVMVPANASLSNVVLTPISMHRMRRVFRGERFDIVHVHEPLAPVVSQYALAAADCPIVITSHASGGRWWWWGRFFWHVLIPRIDYRIAVSEASREVARRFLGEPFEVIPNGVELPERAGAGDREQHVVFIGRNDARKGLEVLLRAWPAVTARTSARLRVIGADPLSVRFLLRRLGLPEGGVDLLGVVPEDVLVGELLRAKILAAPAIGWESFGMVLTRAFACSTPVVASDIPGYREVAEPGTGVLVPPGDADALARALVELLEDEPRRRLLGKNARRTAEEKYAWTTIATRLVEIYSLLLAGDAVPFAPSPVGEPPEPRVLA